MTIQTSPGDRIQYTPSSDVSAGSAVVVGELVGIALDAIEANREGTLMIEGVFLMSRATVVIGGIDPGDALYWDTNPRGISHLSTGNTRIGRAAESGAQLTTLPILVWLNR